MNTMQITILFVAILIVYAIYKGLELIADAIKNRTITLKLPTMTVNHIHGSIEDFDNINKA